MEATSHKTLQNKIFIEFSSKSYSKKIYIENKNHTKYRGCVDHVSGNIIHGWCCTSEGEVCNVNVIVNNKHLIESCANKKREDLIKKGICLSGGFSIDTSIFLDNIINEIEVLTPEGNRLSKEKIIIKKEKSR